MPQRCGAVPVGPHWGGCMASTRGSGVHPGPHLCEGCPDHWRALTRQSVALQANSTEHKGQGPGHTRKAMENGAGETQTSSSSYLGTN